MTVKAPAGEVFEFLAEPESLPLWATCFCDSIRKEDGCWIVTSERGDSYLTVDANRVGGIVDLYAGPTLESMALLPIRIATLGGGETAAIFSFLKEPSIPDADYERRYRELVSEVSGLAERFGGGDVSSEPVKSRVYPGFVTSKPQELRDFYRDRLGFSVSFDSPFYVQLVHPLTGDQLGLMGKDAQGCGSHREFETEANGFGYWLSVETLSVDADFERLRAEGAPVVEEPKNQPWGERTCIVKDPNGTLVYLSQKNGAMDKSLRQYVVMDTAALALHRGTKKPDSRGVGLGV